MSAVSVVPLDGASVIVKELTVAEVRQWALLLESGEQIDPIRCMALADCSLDDLAQMCDMTADQLEHFGKTDLEKIREKAKAMNPHFFRVREALTSVSQGLMVAAESQPLMPSSAAFMPAVKRRSWIGRMASFWPRSRP